MSSETGLRLRIDDLSQRSGIASGTIRFYQREGLIAPPQREGRVAYYSEQHLRRLARIRALQAQRLPLALIRDLLEREDAGQDISPWLALDSAVFGRRGLLERVDEAALERLGFGPGELEALLRAGALRRADDGALEGFSGLLELTGRLVESGVPAATVGAGAELLAGRLREVADTIADVGWGVFAADRDRLAASDERAADEVLARLEQLRALAEEIVATLFPRLLDEAVRARVEPFALQTVKRRAP